MNVTGVTKSVEERQGCGGRANVRFAGIKWKARRHHDDGRSESVPMGGESKVWHGQRLRGAMKEMIDSRVPSIMQLLQGPPSGTRSHLHLLFLH